MCAVDPMAVYTTAGQYPEAASARLSGMIVGWQAALLCVCSRQIVVLNQLLRHVAE